MPKVTVKTEEQQQKKVTFDVGHTRPANKAMKNENTQTKIPVAKFRRMKSIPYTLEDLRTIWEMDKRVPTAESRRKWAIARGVKPTLVGSWFSNRKREMEKAGQPCIGTYELAVDAPPITCRRKAEKPRVKMEDVKVEEPKEDLQAKGVLSDSSIRNNLPPVVMTMPTTPRERSPPSTPALSFSLSSPRSSSPVNVDHLLLKPPPITYSQKASSYGPLEGSHEYTWRAPESYDIASPQEVMSTYESVPSNSKTARIYAPIMPSPPLPEAKTVLSLASRADVLRNPPMALQDLDIRAGIGPPFICSAAIRQEANEVPIRTCALCREDNDTNYTELAPFGFGKSLVPEMNHTYSLLAQPEVQYPLYNNFATNPLLSCDTLKDCDQFNWDVNYGPYDTMELSGVPFMNFVANLPPDILDPVDPIPIAYQQLQLLEGFLSGYSGADCVC